jgi:hypothetical protein
MCLDAMLGPGEMPMSRLGIMIFLAVAVLVSACGTTSSVQGRGSENGGGGRAKVGVPF